jgi:hypothetical protein
VIVEFLVLPAGTAEESQLARPEGLPGPSGFQDRARLTIGNRADLG